MFEVAGIKGGQLLITPQISIDRSIVAPGSEDSKQAFAELRQVVAEIRQQAKDKGIDKMSIKGINRAVASARRDMKKVANNPAK